MAGTPIAGLDGPLISLPPCTPTSCLEIPPVSSLARGALCSVTFRWYRIWPIILDLPPVSGFLIDDALARIAAAGGTVYSAEYVFRDAAGNCTLLVDVLYPNPGPPVLPTPQVGCPPGYRYDPFLEQCLLDLPIIIPLPPPPGPGPGPEPVPVPKPGPGGKPDPPLPGHSAGSLPSLPTPLALPLPTRAIAVTACDSCQDEEEEIL